MIKWLISLLVVIVLFAFNVSAIPLTTTMEEGQRSNFTLGSSFFDIEVMIIDNSSPATVTFRINGQITPQMIENDSFFPQNGARIFINNITLNEAGEPGTGDTVTLTLFYCRDALCDGQQTGGRESCLSCTSDCGCQSGYACRSYNPPACFLIVCGDNWCSAGETCALDSCCKGNQVNFERDRNNCGACGNVCQEDQICLNSLCQRRPPDQCSSNNDCDDHNSCTIDICGETFIRTCHYIPILYCDSHYASYGGSFELNPQGSDEYTLEFANRYDIFYEIPYLTNEQGTFKYGDTDKDLVFVEANFSESMTFEDAQR